MQPDGYDRAEAQLLADRRQRITGCALFIGFFLIPAAVALGLLLRGAL